MLPKYEDILSRIKEEPIWYDDNGVPRYEPFHPNMLGVYDDAVVYFKIKCQSCEKIFLVAEGVSVMQRLKSKWMKAGLSALNYENNSTSLEKIKSEAEPYNVDTLESSIEYGLNTPHYGDPPRHNLEDDKRCVGEVMNCYDIEVLEFWINDGFREWKRHPEYEGVIPEDMQ